MQPRDFGLVRTTTLDLNYIYIYHLEQLITLPMYPDTIEDLMQTTFTSTNALSRSAPVQTFSYSGPRTVTVSLQLHRDMLNEANMELYNTQSIENHNDVVDYLISTLQSIALPHYNADNSKLTGVVPPMIAIRFGNTMFIKGVVGSGVTVEYEKPIMYDKKYARAKISFSVIETEPYDAKTVAAVGSFRSIAAGG